MMRFPKISILHRYVLTQFLISLLVCLLAASALFLITDFFEKTRVFVKEGSSFSQAATYMFYKIPLIVQLMMPVAVLVAVLLSLGRLSQLSEITGMRAAGASLIYLAKPLVAVGLLISVLMFIAGETLVPWATERVEEIYNLDIRKKAVLGRFDRADFWYRAGDSFYNIGLYDSRNSTLNGLSIYTFNRESFKLKKRIDAQRVVWSDNPQIGWTMEDAVEVSADAEGRLQSSTYPKLPLLIAETPADFYKMRRKAETLSYADLGPYIEKLAKEGVPVTEYMVERASKISFPFVNAIVILIAFPFALTPARSGNMTLSFIAGVSIGFGYYIVHAISTSLGSAELLPVMSSAWTANIILGCIGGYLMGRMEYS